MGYLIFGLFAWLVLCSPALIYAIVMNGRRRREAAELSQKITSLTWHLETLEQKFETAIKAAQAAPTADAPQARTVAETAPARPVAAPAAEKTAPPISKPVVAPAAEIPPVKPAAKAPETVVGIPVPPKVQPEAPKPAPPVTPIAPAPPPPVPKPTTVPSVAAGSAAQTPPPGTAARVQAPTTAPLHLGGYSSAGVAAPRKAISSRLEEGIGMKWFAWIGSIIVVLGIALLVASKWSHIPLVLRVAMIYAGGWAMLALGILAEHKTNYRILGRSLIAGGWAVTFLTTYAISHAQSLLILSSTTADLFLLLAVTAVMVWHTLKYKSQAVTGVAFLLGFASVTLNPDPPYNLVAGALLVAGMTVIVLRRQWFELEVFGILASYLNHLYWLYKIIEPMGEHKTRFPEFNQSAALVFAYWTIFRVSYLWRKVSNKEQESVSTIAALLSPLLLLGVLKYQAYESRWAFTLLLVLGAVEFILGQLPVSRRRGMPFYILSSLGATCMIAAFPFRYSGNKLELLWLAGSEAFLLAGIFAKEKLFRRFGWIISFLVVLWLLPARVVPLMSQIFYDQPHYDAQIAIVFAAVAAVLYANTHIIARLRPEFFTDELDRTAFSALSFVASFFAVGAIYLFVPEHAVAVAIAALVLMLSWTGRQFKMSELVYQAHWIASVAFIETIARGRALETNWHAIPERTLVFGSVAVMLYVSSRFVRFSETVGKNAFAAVYTVAGTALLTLLVWYQSPDWLIAVLWIGLGLALSLFAQIFERTDLKWQVFTLVLLSFTRAVLVNFDVAGTWHHLSYRLISVSLIAVGTYLLTRSSPIPLIRPVYSVLGTFLLSILAFKETPEPWIAVAWIALALTLSIAARLWKDRALLWQTHLLSALATVWTLYANFAPQYRGGKIQFATVAITATALYVLTWATNIANVIENARMSQGYSWAGSLLLSWLAWYQLRPEYVSAAWAIFGLVLFEIGTWRSWKYLRVQAYVVLVCSVAHIFYFYANSNAPVEVWRLGPGVYAVLPLALIFFWIYGRLHKEAVLAQSKSDLRVEHLLACLGTAAVAAVARFEIPVETVAAGYALIVVALLVVAWRCRLQVFMFQALVMLGVAAFRISAHNFFTLHDLVSGSLSYTIAAIALLAVGVPVALAWRKTEPQVDVAPAWLAAIIRHPEQPMFFVALVLTAVLLAIKMPGGMVTLTWGAEGIVVFLLALLAKERSFRLAGVGLLLLCVGKILCWDAWQFHDLTARYSTLIGVGLILLIVSFLYGKNRKALREYL